MSTVRRYLLPFFAACVALAVGIALGAGPLQGAASADGPPASTSDAPALRDRVLSLEQGSAFNESLTAAASAGLLGNRLDGAAVTLVVLPGVGDDIVAGMRNALTRAGGLVEVTARLSPRLVDPAQKTYATSVATDSIRGLRDLASASPHQPFAQLGALIARAYAGTGTDLRLDDEAIKIDSELQGAKLVALDGQPHRRGSLVMVLGSGNHGRDDVTTATHLIEVELVSSLAAGADAVLVATPPTGTTPGGLLDAVSSQPALDRRLSTLNVTAGSAAQVAAVYALASAADGTSGAYGIQGTTATLPPGLAGRGG